MTTKAITLLGRASNIGTADQEFTTVVRWSDGQTMPIRCECRSSAAREAFEAIGDGDLIGVIGTIAKGTSGDRMLVLIDRLERLGGSKPVA